MSNVVKNPTKVITGKKCIMSYLNVNEPKVPLGGGTPKYSVSIIIPKSDTVTVEKIKAAIQAAYTEGEFSAGNHCRFCKVKATCRKRAEYSMELAKYDFVEAPTLDSAEIAEILPRIDSLVSWAEDIKEYALEQALSGTRYPGFKLVEGRSNRKYTNEAEVARVVSAAGYEPFEKKLLGVTAMTKQLGKKRFEELLQGLIIKPQGKPVLVPETDKRPVFSSASNDFMEE